MGYQENSLIKENVLAGHNVLVISSTETLDARGCLIYLKPSSYLGSDGAQVVRLPYVRWLPHFVAKKLRVHPSLLNAISEFRPDAILFHGCAGREIVTAGRYVEKNRDVIFYIDCHEDFNNSARGVISRNLLHRAYYKRKLAKALPFAQKILCISVDTRNFASSLYGVPQGRLEIFPLGGSIENDQTMQVRRSAVRYAMGLTDQHFVYLQSGKFTGRKKLASSLIAFSKLPGDHLHFWIAGVLSKDIEPDIMEKISADCRVKFLGWKSTDELRDLLYGADVYLQPGTQSVTMPNALCCGCPVIIDDVPSHHFYLESGATLVSGNDDLLIAMSAAMNKDRLASR